jgi:dTDP-4-dehydrorhamnose 3,5-epimerase-like enzyme
MESDSLWRGLRPEARKLLRGRDYSASEVEKRLSTDGLEASAALATQRVLVEAGVWIPGVELLARHVYPQRHRGIFSEMARQNEGRLGEIGLWPRQWATARMFAGTAKGFHVHPPFVPEGEDPAAWFTQLYGGGEMPFLLRPYDREQWDVMYFLQGRLDLILCDERAGLPRRVMRLFFDGDNHRGPNTAGVVIPAGVAHALRTEGSEDLVMAYGTTTVFQPAFEGRMVSQIEEMPYPPEWADYLGNASK